jgi:hypothetical protein
MAGAQLALKQGAYDIAAGELEQAVQPAVLDQLTPAKRQEAVELYGRATWYNENYAKSHWAFRLATSAPWPRQRTGSG